MTKKGKFKARGSEILQPAAAPKTMRSFLSLPGNTDTKAHGDTDVNEPKPEATIAQTHLSTNAHESPHRFSPEISDTAKRDSGLEHLTRLHVHIRKDLADALFEEVCRRKTDRSVPNKNATQRIVVEQALASFFQSQRESKKNQEVSHNG